jgi:hypothetical protein
VINERLATSDSPISLFGLPFIFVRSLIVAVRLTIDGPPGAMPLVERAQEAVRAKYRLTQETIEYPSAQADNLDELIDVVARYLVERLGREGARTRADRWASRLPNSVTQILAEAPTRLEMGFWSPLEITGRKSLWTWEALAVVVGSLQKRLAIDDLSHG